MRLDKYLAQMGQGTRSEVRGRVRRGEVTVNKVTVRDPAAQVSESDDVTLGGEPVVYEAYVYYMLNKPAGVISATEDPRERTVLDLIPEKKRKDLFPAGRLDRDTEGLLLITNDGKLAHRLLSPSHHVDKVYYARLDSPVGEREIRLFAEGLRVDETLTAMPAQLRILRDDREGGISEPEKNSNIRGEMAGRAEDNNRIAGCEVLVTIHEGKFHQVRRMFEAVNREVLYLKRLSMGPLQLDPKLAPGEYRRLTEAERSAIMNV